jgi:hypothetical protein
MKLDPETPALSLTKSVLKFREPSGGLLLAGTVVVLGLQ